MFIGQGLSVACQGVYFVLLARLLGSVEYGIYVGAFAMVAILSVYSPMGSPFTLLRHVSPSPGKFASYWGNVLMTTFTLGSLFVALLVWCVPHLAHSYSWKLVLCAAVGDCLCGQLTDACARVFQAFEKMRITAFISVLVNLLRTMLVGILLWRFHHATAQQWVAAALAVSFAAAIISLMLVTRQYGRPKISFQLLRERTGEGVVFALSSSTMGIYNNIDKAMLGHYGMNAANGIYSMAYRVIDIATMPIGSIHAAAFPRFFCKGAGGVRSTTAYALQILKRTGPLALLLTTGMLVTAPIIPYLVGDSFRESVLALRWLCLLPVFRSFQLSAGDALTGSGHLKLRLGIQAAAAVFNFSVNLCLIPHYGWLGAAWASLAADGLLGVVNWTVLLAIQSESSGRQI
jgi:O-antigen/teichoic acid export membrane protein